MIIFLLLLEKAYIDSFWIVWPVKSKQIAIYILQKLIYLRTLETYIKIVFLQQKNNQQTLFPQLST